MHWQRWEGSGAEASSSRQSQQQLQGLSHMPHCPHQGKQGSGQAPLLQQGLRGGTGGDGLSVLLQGSGEELIQPAHEWPGVVIQACSYHGIVINLIQQHLGQFRLTGAQLV